MLNLISKLTVAGGTISSVFLIENVGTDVITTRQDKKIEKSTGNTTFNSIEDIELFERTNGCTFLYVNTWANRDLYTARGIFENLKKEGRDIKKEALQGANLEEAKNVCKSQKGVVTLTSKQSGSSYVWELKKGGW